MRAKLNIVFISAAAIATLTLVLPSVARDLPKAAGVERLQPAFDDVVAGDAQPVLLRDGFKKGLEGGVWLKDKDLLIFSNKPEQVINSWTVDGTMEVYLDLHSFVEPPGTKMTMSSGMTLDREGRLVYASAGEQAVIRVEADGGRTVLADSFDGKRLKHPNDLIYRSDGVLYFTDQGDVPPGRTAELTFDGAYMLKDGEVVRVASDMKRPNGIAISPDEKHLYVSDSDELKLYRYALNDDGTTGEREVVVDTSPMGSIDGMRVDNRGDILLSLPGGVWILSEDGTRLGSVVIPDRVSNIAFGDPDGRTLYMMGHTTLYKIRLKTEGRQIW